VESQDDPVDVQQVELKSRLGSFKQAPRRSVHSFHRYFGKLIPAIPAFAIEEFTTPNQTVLDPFCGSGTTLLEAACRGRASIGMDINPLATFVSEVKTTSIPRTVLENELEQILSRWIIGAKDAPSHWTPYVVNLQHWFRPNVLVDLLWLKFVIDGIEEKSVRKFFLGVFSAFLRGVSNADPQHVFPGYSKRMRALDAAGRQIDVRASFVRAARKRIQQISELPEGLVTPSVITGRFVDVEFGSEKVDLVVTNPPYISSIRYLETMKIEMGWLGYLESKDQYLKMDRSTVGTERYYKRELEVIPRTQMPYVDKHIEVLESENAKMAMTVSRYFLQMREVFEKISQVLKLGGTLLVKISDTKVRSQLIPTSQIFVEICEEFGLSLVADIIDEFDPNSRSLLTSRNTYSGLMTFDHVLVLQR
jgi:DNA modification methylase